MKRYLLPVLALTLASSTGCKKTVPTVEAGAMDAAVADMADAAMPVAEALDAGPATPLATAKPVAVVKHDAGVDAGHAATVAASDFSGTYTCFGGMTIVQTGNSVSARMFPAKSDNYSTMTCSAAGDACAGKSTPYTAGKAGEPHDATFTRNPTNGNLTYKGVGEGGSTLCRKK